MKPLKACRSQSYPNQKSSSRNSCPNPCPWHEQIYVHYGISPPLKSTRLQHPPLTCLLLPTSERKKEAAVEMAPVSPCQFVSERTPRVDNAETILSTLNLRRIFTQTATSKQAPPLLRSHALSSEIRFTAPHTRFYITTHQQCRSNAPTLRPIITSEMCVRSRPSNFCGRCLWKHSLNAATLLFQPGSSLGPSTRDSKGAVKPPCRELLTTFF